MVFSGIIKASINGLRNLLMKTCTNPHIHRGRRKCRHAPSLRPLCKIIPLIAALILFLPGCSSTEDTAIEPDTQETSTATASPTPEATSWTFGEVEDNGDIEINPAVLAALQPRTYEFSYVPTVLIYHTHATEAFLQDENYTYEETEAWRTDDNDNNIVYVGEVLKTYLESLGFNVIHDTSNVEPPDITSAYSRSLEVMQKYEDVDIYIDVHRNAADVERVRDNTVLINGEECAKMFFVVGTGIGTYEGEYDIAPDWEANYTFAYSVQNAVSESAPGMMKTIRTKVGRYNQHMGMCLLVEIGNNANTMEQALNSVSYLADALDEVISFDK